VGTPLKKLTIKGFKSIESIEDIEIGNPNILIGANGAGKSNFVDFFRMLRAMAEQGLQDFVATRGVDGLFFLGPKTTRQITAHLTFGQNTYDFTLEPTAGKTLKIASERVRYLGGGNPTLIGAGTIESALKSLKDEKAIMGQGPGVCHYVYDAISSWMVYHFHDTSMLSPMRREQAVRNFRELSPDAGNIAAFLLRMKQLDNGRYLQIRDTIRQIAPFFDDFLLEPETKGADEFVRLEWRQKGSSFPFQPSHFSDGTIRFICLATALLQAVPPATVVIDEPELGLHPQAISLLAELIRSAASRTQVIVSTQSTTLLDHFAPEEIIVVNRKKGASTFEKLDVESLASWREEYSLGELWQKDVLRGGPASD